MPSVAVDEQNKYLAKLKCIIVLQKMYNTYKMPALLIVIQALLQNKWDVKYAFEFIESLVDETIDYANIRSF